VTELRSSSTYQTSGKLRPGPELRRKNRLYMQHAAEQGRGADCFQRPLRSRFQQQLTPGVMPLWRYEEPDRS
jgi:hypothetical protein